LFLNIELKILQELLLPKIQKILQSPNFLMYRLNLQILNYPKILHYRQYLMFLKPQKIRRFLSFLKNLMILRIR
jgi:hypothetical protein